VQGKEKRLAGYGEYDWYFDINAAGQVVFDYLEIDNEQVRKLPNPGNCQPRFQCLGATGLITGSDGTDMEPISPARTSVAMDSTRVLADVRSDRLEAASYGVVAFHSPRQRRR
jgi:hypothetical protein